MPAIKITEEEHDKDYLSLVRSLVSAETARLMKGKGFDGSKAHAEAIANVARAANKDPEKFRVWFVGELGKTMREGREKHKDENGVIVEVQQPEDESQGAFIMPEVKEAMDDPFAEDSLISRLVAAYRHAKVGVVYYQMYKTEVQAKSARSAMHKVASRLKWKRYDTKVEGRVLWVKRLRVSDK